MSDDNTRGLYSKYVVARNDGKALKGGAIVLEFGDPLARPAILTWANKMWHSGYKQVYEDVISALARASKRSIGLGDYIYLEDASIWRVNGITEDKVGGATAAFSEPVVHLLKCDHERKATKRDYPLFELKRQMVIHQQPDED